MKAPKNDQVSIAAELKYRQARRKRLFDLYEEDVMQVDVFKERIEELKTDLDRLPSQAKSKNCKAKFILMTRYRIKY